MDIMGKRMTRILFQGDSVTDGEHSRVDDNDPGYCYPLYVRKELDVTCPDEYQILNRGINGNRVRDIYARMTTDIIELAPDIMSVLVGVNDVIAFVRRNENGTEPDEFYRVYEDLIKDIKDALPNIKIMIIEPFVLKGAETERDWEMFYANVCQYAQITRKIAEKYELQFVALQDVFEEAAEKTSPDYWLVDGIHTTEKGAALIAREWLKGFRKMNKT